jgi:5-carboxymethyl-2-hydroxymuconate isomerase
VLAYPAPHFAISDGGAAGRTAGGDGDYGFVYLNLRMGRGRSEAVQQDVGRALATVAKSHFETLMATMHIGVTLQIDVGTEVFDAKHSTLHPLFHKPV